METASYFREKAAQCRRLAAHILARNDPTASSLMALAVEFDAAASVIDAPAVAARAVEYGNNAPPDSRPPVIAN